MRRNRMINERNVDNKLIEFCNLRARRMQADRKQSERKKGSKLAPTCRVTRLHLTICIAALQKRTFLPLFSFFISFFTSFLQQTLNYRLANQTQFPSGHLLLRARIEAHAAMRANWSRMRMLQPTQTDSSFL